MIIRQVGSSFYKVRTKIHQKKGIGAISHLSSVQLVDHCSRKEKYILKMLDDTIFTPVLGKHNQNIFFRLNTMTLLGIKNHFVIHFILQIIRLGS